MAEPLRNHFGPDIPARIGEMIGRVYGEFDGEAFLAAALDGFEELELTERARHISAALADVLPGDRKQAIELLDLLKDDPEEYVRRSVANNLNDISKDHPDLAVDVARRWWEGAGPDRRRLVRHGLRTLIKKGHQGALAILGFGGGSPATVATVSCEPTRVEIGGKTRLEVEILNPSQDATGALVDFRVHFVKANGSTSPKVFKGAERYLEAGERATIRKTISLAQQSTRTPYPGRHQVEIMLNGVTHPGVFFEVT